MIKTKRIEETKAVEIVEDVLCNLCGQSCKDEHYPNNVLGPLSVNDTGCYGQTFPPDLENWEIDICQYCFAWIVAHCRIAPRRREYYIGLLAASSKECLLEPETPDTVLSAILTGDTSKLDDDENWRKQYERVLERDTLIVKHPNRKTEDETK